MASLHPEYDQEAAFLTQTFAVIDQALDHQDEHYFEGGANNYTNRMLNTSVRADVLERLQEFGLRPYFARVDFTGTRGEQTVYFGHAHLPFPHGQVLDWRCDLYSLYVGTHAREQRYLVQATGVTHQVDLLLKRRLDIARRVLNDIDDLVDRRPLRPVVAAIPVGDAVTPDATIEPIAPGQDAPISDPALVSPRDDAYLIRQLYTRGDPQLQDIVETIQVQQDEIIRAPLDTLLLLHGVAGSGKTSIAYHRLAYLLYPEHGYHLSPKDLLVIGPNQTFLGYVRDLLPSLGVTGIRQRTFHEWAWSRMHARNRSLPFRVEFIDGVEQALHNPQISLDARSRLWLAAKLKGDLRFEQLLARYAAWLRDRTTLPTDDIAVQQSLEGEEKTFTLTQSDYQAAWAVAQGEPTLDAQRQRFVEELARRPGEWFRLLYGPPERRGDQPFIARLVRDVRKRLAAVWRRPNLLRLYTELFEPIRLAEIAADLYTEEEQGVLVGTAPQPPQKVTAEASDDLEKAEAEPVVRPRRTTVDLSDIAGLFLLNAHIIGNGPASFRHLVVDEAQDFSPLQMKLLFAACPSGSMTIVGDTAQSIHAYRGIDDWEDLHDVLPQTQVRRERITQNYRSTREIVAFGNALQHAIRGERALPSEAINRTGPSPRLVQLISHESLLAALAQAVHEARNAGFDGIAIIASDGAHAVQLGAALGARGIEHQLIQSDAEATPDKLGGTVVLPAALTKGLEFQMVLLADASEERYPTHDPYAGQLLYVAVSRALHVLQVFSVGAWTRWLTAAETGSDTIRESEQALTQDNIALVRKQIGHSLRQAAKTIRRERVPIRQVLPQLSTRVDQLYATGSVGEILAAYQIIGQFGRYSVNDLLLRLLAVGDRANFLKQALAFGAPALLQDDIEDTLAWYESSGQHDAQAWRSKFAELLQ